MDIFYGINALMRNAWNGRIPNMRPTAPWIVPFINPLLSDSFLSFMCDDPCSATNFIKYARKHRNFMSVTRSVFTKKKDNW